MEGAIDDVRLSCPARTHARAIGKRFIRIRCRDKNCPDVRAARLQGKICIHVWDLTSGETWSEYEEVNNGRNSSLQP